MYWVYAFAKWYMCDFGRVHGLHVCVCITGEHVCACACVYVRVHVSGRVRALRVVLSCVYSCVYVSARACPYYCQFTSKSVVFTESHFHFYFHSLKEILGTWNEKMKRDFLTRTHLSWTDFFTVISSNSGAHNPLHRSAQKNYDETIISATNMALFKLDI